jgi:hypothetical protein
VHCQAKSKISKDPRYDAVGSSSLREELYNTFIKAQDAPHSSEKSDVVEDVGAAVENTASKQERRERAVREREAHVRTERQKLEADIDRSKFTLNREEGEELFRCAGCRPEDMLGADCVSSSAQC